MLGRAGVSVSMTAEGSSEHAMCSVIRADQGEVAQRQQGGAAQQHGPGQGEEAGAGHAVLHADEGDAEQQGADADAAGGHQLQRLLYRQQQGRQGAAGDHQEPQAQRAIPARQPLPGVEETAREQQRDGAGAADAER